jgi:hypothetical protein
MKQVIWVLTVTLFMLSACATPTPTAAPTLIPTALPSPSPTSSVPLATSAKDIVGIWAGLDRDAIYQQFNADGTCQMAVFVEDLTNQPDFACTFRFEGTRLVMKHEGHPKGLPPCPNVTNTYGVQLLSADRIKFVKVDDVCRGRATSTAQEHKRIR